MPTNFRAAALSLPLASFEFHGTNLTVGHIHSAGELKIGKAPAKSRRRLAIYPIAPSGIVVRNHIAEPDLSKTVVFDPIRNGGLACLNRLCRAVAIPPLTVVIGPAFAVVLSAARLGSTPSTRVPTVPLASIRSLPLQVHSVTFPAALRIVDPKYNPAPALPRILEQLDVPSAINAAEAEVPRIGGHSPVAREASPGRRLSAEIPDSAHVSLDLHLGGSIHHYLDRAFSVLGVSGNVCPLRHRLCAANNGARKRECYCDR